MHNTIIGIGNCGSQIVKAAAMSSKLTDTKFYSIDSQTSSIDMGAVDVTYIPIISDEKTGSGRNRERGNAMYCFHESQGEFEEMYKDCQNSKSPVVVITSAAGGTGSGAVVPLCKSLMSREVQVIPIIICPNLNDPDAYQLNTADLMLELQEAGIETYCIFRNIRGDADYTPVNNDVVNAIEIIFGKRYDHTDLDSIDDSDLDVILDTPGRFVAITAEASDIESLKKELTRKIRTGYQPSWTDDEANKCTFMVAYSLTSLFAKQDFREVFSEVNNRIVHMYDEYRNICQIDNDGKCTATLIVAGLPRAEMKLISSNFNEASAIGDGIEKSKRPKFMQRKKAVVTPPSDGSAMSAFKWKK